MSVIQDRPSSWEQVVAAMRTDFVEMAADPQHTGRAFLRVAAMYERFRAQVALALGVTTEQAATLLILWDAGRLSPGDLAPLVGRSTAAIWQIIGKLETHGYVELLPAPQGNRRMMHVIVTPRADTALIGLVEGLAAQLASTEPEMIESANALRDVLGCEAGRLAAAWNR